MDQVIKTELFWKSNKPWSKYSIGLIVVFWIALFFINKEWNHQHIISDVIIYYDYLPAKFIYKDLSLQFTLADPKKYEFQFWPQTTSDGKLVLKMTMGLSYLYGPFFLIANEVAKIKDYPVDGFSLPYQVGLMVSALFYLFIGLYFLRKLLLLFYDEVSTAITIISIYFGTNLLWYTTGEALMSHGFLFSVSAAYLYLMVMWSEKPTLIRTIFLGALIGLMILIRPTMTMMLIPFVYYLLSREGTFKKMIAFLWKQKVKIILMIVFCFLVLLPQSLYWHSITGKYIYYSYTQERFFWSHPHIIDALISYRKGWLIYSPIMIISLIGLFIMKNKERIFFKGILVTLISALYILFCWWTWSYGGSFGSRPMVDYYAMLAIPFASGINYFRENVRRTYFFIPIASFLLFVGLFQNWQYSKGMIHFDGNTKRSYWKNFLRFSFAPGWWDTLERPDYDAAIKGIDAIDRPGKDRYNFDYLKYSNRQFIVTNFAILNRSNKYSHALTIPLEDIKKLKIDSVYINTSMLCFDKLKEKDLTAIFSFKNNQVERFSYNPDLKTNNRYIQNKWVKLQTGIWIDSTQVSLFDQLEIFISNKTDNTVLFKDYTVSYTTR